MGYKTEIGWTDSTWNPITGCTRVSPGCENCYIELSPLHPNDIVTRIEFRYLQQRYLDQGGEQP